MKTIKLNYENVLNHVSNKEILDNKTKTNQAMAKLLNKEGLGSEFTGWVDFPLEITEDYLEEIINVKNYIREISDCLVVIGIGGSYLGSRAAIEALSDYYKKGDFKVIFLGNNVSSSYLYETLEYLKNKNFAVNVISKSGKTLEPAIAFRMVKKLLEEKYPDDFSKRVIVTTSKQNSILHDYALECGFKEFYIPDSIGGRYSVLTAVGLLPIACAGFDILEIIKGSISASQDLRNTPYKENPSLLYASIRNLLYKKGYTTEIFVTYEPKLKYLGEWWMQLFGESEGKDNKGILPLLLTYSTDLHSMGQYVQDGIRNMFETVIDVTNDKYNITIAKDEDNIDELNYLANKDMKFVKDQALNGTIQAHVSGGVSNLVLSVEKINEFTFGYLVYFYMFTCGVSGYLLGVNPFNQNGVEAYKKNMFSLLKK